jgi:hypothetical protein
MLGNLPAIARPSGRSVASVEPKMISFGFVGRLGALLPSARRAVGRSLPLSTLMMECRGVREVHCSLTLNHLNFQNCNLLLLLLPLASVRPRPGLGLMSRCSRAHVTAKLEACARDDSR